MYVTTIDWQDHACGEICCCKMKNGISYFFYLTDSIHECDSAECIDVCITIKRCSNHTWGNGIGLLANAHLFAGCEGGPWLEYPIDPPEWTPARRVEPRAAVPRTFLG